VEERVAGTACAGIDSRTLHKLLEAAVVEKIDEVGCQRIAGERSFLTVATKLGGEVEERLALHDRATHGPAKLVAYQ
jgi:hypothetical protein